MNMRFERQNSLDSLMTSESFTAEEATVYKRALKWQYTKQWDCLLRKIVVFQCIQKGATTLGS